ncbi:hypothetical protein BJ742DRAFT_794800 [Cladochytrium replicatum]|nr:hypothetical protein BJ742DRAFT_794800 [Cladochytrium replicatum]
MPFRVRDQPHLLSLPHEILLNILRGLPLRDLAAVSCCCRHLNTLAVADSLWRPIVADVYKPSTDSFVRPAIAPTTNVRQFLANLSVEHCFRCGIKATGKSALGRRGELVLAMYKRRYCKGCQRLELLTHVEAKDTYLVSDKELATLRHLEKPVHPDSHQSSLLYILYLRDHVHSLAMRRWGSETGLEEERHRRKPRRTTSAIAAAVTKDPQTESEDDFCMNKPVVSADTHPFISSPLLSFGSSSSSALRSDTGTPNSNSSAVMDEFDDGVFCGTDSGELEPLDVPKQHHVAHRNTSPTTSTVNTTVDSSFVSDDESCIRYSNRRLTSRQSPPRTFPTRGGKHSVRGRKLTLNSRKALCSRGFGSESCSEGEWCDDWGGWFGDTPPGTCNCEECHSG